MTLRNTIIICTLLLTGISFSALAQTKPDSKAPVQKTKYKTGTQASKKKKTSVKKAAPKPVVQPKTATKDSAGATKEAPKAADSQKAAPLNPADLPLEPDMVLVDGGSFLMGSNDGEQEEKPIHKVSVGSFYLAKTEVTVAQYREFCRATNRQMPEEPKWGWQDHFPIVNVSWKDAQAYCDWLAQKTGQKFRLPTEAEWEFAARGGKKTQKYHFAGSNTIEEVAWFDKNSNKQAHGVGSKKPNELGLYDMTGNVWEWVADWFGEDYYANSPERDPQGPRTGAMRVMRSGSYVNYPGDNRIAIRISNMPDDTGPFFGFRVAKGL
ncbi:MAG: formylglycine-generating enzyme family protein [Bernardetiaceae bacterium]|jgi:formylglycine-generating enzyme required for sulfatase activity|nr:formylglycine-generating enzyme family protein [Bernardetiaceae bacterium]